MQKRFIEPTCEECIAYFVLNGFYDAEEQANAFYDYFASIGWIVGKKRTPMIDWQAAARTWNRNQLKSNPQKVDLPNNPAEIEEFFRQYRNDIRNPKQEATDAWNHYRSIGWKDGSGKPVINWRAKLISWGKNQQQTIKFR